MNGTYDAQSLLECGLDGDGYDYDLRTRLVAAAHAQAAIDRNEILTRIAAATEAIAALLEEHPISVRVAP